MLCRAGLAHVCRVLCKGLHGFPYCHYKSCTDLVSTECSTVVSHLQPGCQWCVQACQAAYLWSLHLQTWAILPMPLLQLPTAAESRPLCALQLQSLLRRRPSAGRQLLAWRQLRICSTSWTASAPEAASACQHAAPLQCWQLPTALQLISNFA